MSDEAIVAQTGPFQVELTEGQEYWFCRCGRSKTQPFCDGSHEGTTFEPLRFIVEQTGGYDAPEQMKRRGHAIGFRAVAVRHLVHHARGLGDED